MVTVFWHFYSKDSQRQSSWERTSKTRLPCSSWRNYFGIAVTFPWCTRLVISLLWWKSWNWAHCCTSVKSGEQKGPLYCVRSSYSKLNDIVHWLFVALCGKRISSFVSLVELPNGDKLRRKSIEFKTDPETNRNAQPQPHWSDKRSPCQKLNLW